MNKTNRGFWRWALLATIAIGIVFRIFHADWKFYSSDETITSLRASGFSIADFDAAVKFDGKPHQMETLERFQQPSSTSTVANILRSLRTEDPQHPPLYYLVTAAVGRMFTIDSLYVRRLPAIVFSICAIFAAWWFGRILFAESQPALIFAALVAVSPFHQAYAQEAREYSLWALVIFISCGFFLLALRSGRAAIPAYALTVAAGLWTHTFFAFVVVAHALFLFLPQTEVTRRRKIELALAIVAGILAFAPWIAVEVGGGSTMNAGAEWMRFSLSPAIYAAKWFFNAGTVFFDLDYVSAAFAPIALALLILSMYCIRTFVRKAAPSIVALVSLLGLVPFVAVLFYDLVFHHSYGAQSRYLTPLWIALELGTAFGISRLMEAENWRRLFAQVMTAAFVFAGISSLAVASCASSWWVASNGRSVPAVAEGLSTRPNSDISYVDDKDVLLELLPIVPQSITYSIHAALNETSIATSRDSVAVLRPSEVPPSLRASITLVPLPRLFPSAQDPLIARLRRHGSADRRNVATDDIALYAP